MEEQQIKNKKYEEICKEAESISREVERHGLRVRGFEDYIYDLNVIQRKYVEGFYAMTSMQRTDAYHLLDMVKEQIHGKLDVLRALAMSGVLRRMNEEKK